MNHKMNEASAPENLERLGLILAFIAGFLLFINGLRFAVFGAMLATIMPVSGAILIIAGLFLGSAVLLSLFIYWKVGMLGAVAMLLSSAWGTLVVDYPYLAPVMGVVAALILLYNCGPAISKKQGITIVITVVLVLVPLFGVLASRSEGYRYLTVDGMQRQYLLHIPDSYDGSEPVPLLVALHGGGGDARNMKRSYGLDTVAERYGFIIAYPDGTGDLQYSLHTWNSGYADVYAFRNNVSDVEFLYDLIEQLIDAYNVNSSAVYMTGHSNGAMMTYRFAAEHAEMVSGIAPVSGSVGGKMTEDSELYVIPDPEHPLSVVHVHGKQDKQVLYEGGKGEKGFLVDRVDLSANDSVEFWVENNNCSSNPIIEMSPNGRIEIWRYADGIDDTQVLLVTLNEGSHAWANMSSEVSNEEFYGSSLAEMIWLLLERI
ncbi:hypothetical protein EU537_05640 [Candidatus Thorarchaeota archaeon]|nr:MAG: hypothetical protein EU537_05640 [Candidatus Thorarchaeota archaeon]